MSWKKAFLLIAGLVLLAWGIDALIHIQERNIQSLVTRAQDCIERKDWNQFIANFDKDFEYESKVTMVGSGKLENAKGRIENFWNRAESIYILVRESEIEVEGEKAQAKLVGNLKFKFPEAGGIAIYKYQMTLHFTRTADEWKISKAEIPELAPGLF